MKKQRFSAIFFALILLAGLLTVPAAAAPADEYEDITIAAKAALLVDEDSGQVLYAQDADEELYPASITKCMTVLLTLQAIDEGKLSLTDTVTASESAIALLTADSSTAGIKVGEQLTVEQLLQCVMVQSANEACYILAETISGSVDAFVAEMNAEAETLGCEHTHFANPCGLQDSDHYTSAWDIYLVIKEALKYEEFQSLSSMTDCVIPATNISAQRHYYTTNYLLSQFRATGYLYSNAKGIKTGHTSDAGYCLVSYAEKGSRGLISVVLGAEAVQVNGKTQVQSFTETKRLFEWGFSSFHNETVLDSTVPAAQVPVTLSSKVNYVVAQPAENVEVLLPNNLSAEDLKQEVTLSMDSVEAPVNKGDVLGTITVTDGEGTVYATSDLLAVTDVPASKLLTAIHKIKLFFSNPLIRILAVIIAVLLIVLIIRHLIRRPKRYRGGQSYRTRRRNQYHGRRR